MVSPRNGEDPQTSFREFNKCINRIVLYETSDRFFVLGSDDRQSRFRVLQIDRSESRDLKILDDGVVYGSREIRDILRMIDGGNRAKVRGQRIKSGLTKTTSAYGIAGFVRFLEGYYIILIKARRKVGVIGYHSIYKIEDTEMIYIPLAEIKENAYDEARYLRSFQAIDLSSNFYYSYSYDLTHTYQYNAEPPTHLRAEDGSQTSLTKMFSPKSFPSKVSYLSEPNDRFLWNDYLTEPVKGLLHNDWILNIIHGFVDHGNINVYGSSILITLIARRSNKYAGTRFLKRGVDFQGNVANEVETEQIAFVGGSSGREVTSFVQHRGSVPSHWTQDISKMVPKPPILVELSDPFATSAGNHFNDLLKRYGSPIICVNLVKKEKKPKRRKHESILTDEFVKSISYLNMFLPPKHRIQYVHFDMAKCRKSANNEVMHHLHEIAYRSLGKTGIYHNRKAFTWYRNRPDSKYTNLVDSYLDIPHNQTTGGSRQTGIVRTNCVDCLDRTNTAQFVIGKCALGFQLFALGYISHPTIEFETDAARMLESMYEDLGDTIALQYGGSQLIHRIKSYRKNANQWTSKANDITQTLRRYYSNTLSDADKQTAINLFLGVFRPRMGEPHIWDKEFYATDSFFHQSRSKGQLNGCGLVSQHNTHWWDRRLRQTLPLPLFSLEKNCIQISEVVDEESMYQFDLFLEYYRPFEMVLFNDNFSYKEVNHTVKDYMPHFCTEFSPFVVRDCQGKREEEMSLKAKNSASFALQYFFFSSKGSRESDKIHTDDTDSESDEDSEPNSDEYDMVSLVDSVPVFRENRRSLETESSASKSLNFSTFFKSSKEVYGLKLKEPDPLDTLLYSNHVSGMRNICGDLWRLYFDDEAKIYKNVSDEDIAIYKEAIEISDSGILGLSVSQKSIEIYEKFVSVV